MTNSRSYRFRKDNRLSDGAQFDRVFKKAARSRDRFFTVLCRQNKVNTARLGLAISKKYCRRATTRNRIKRVIRESFRQHQPAMTGLDIVVINRPAAATASNQQLFASLETHWRRCRNVGRTSQES